MDLTIGDWQFRVDPDATRVHTTQNASDHCDCAYCRNYYEALPLTYPELVTFLESFGISYHGPSEVMPFEPTLVLTCYRVQGEVRQWGTEKLYADGVSILPETSENGTFLLWVGEMPLPWLQEEPMEDVVSPANLPEFLERMEEMWLLRHGEAYFLS